MNPARANPVRRFRSWLAAGGELKAARRRTIIGILLTVLLAGFIWWSLHPFRTAQTLLVVSYDATREYFAAVNAAVTASAGPAAVMSHDGSVQQAHTVARGLVADVLSFASAADIELVASRYGGIEPGWRDRLPYRSSPYTSTIVFLVREGNPKGVRDWDDLFREDVRVASPSPLVSGAGQHAYLTATVTARARAARDGRTGAAAGWTELVSLYARTELIPHGARQALDVFQRQSRADVFLTWENEAMRIAASGASRLLMVAPATGLLAEPVVCVVDRHVDARQTRAGATRYVDFLFSPEGQEIAAASGLRPRLPEVFERHRMGFSGIQLFTIRETLGEEAAVWREHFSPDGRFAGLLRARAALRGGVE